MKRPLRLLAVLLPAVLLFCGCFGSWDIQTKLLETVTDEQAARISEYLQSEIHNCAALGREEIVYVFAQQSPHLSDCRLAVCVNVPPTEACAAEASSGKNGGNDVPDYLISSSVQMGDGVVFPYRKQIRVYGLCSIYVGDGAYLILLSSVPGDVLASLME